MSAATVDIADMQVSNAGRGFLEARSVGSCIAVVLWDPEARVGGILQYSLPESSLAPERARATPCMFCDTGVPELFKKAYELGATKKNLVVRVVGGAHLFDDRGAFNVGKRNYLMLRKLFWKNSIGIASEAVGGQATRHVRLNLENGDLTVGSRAEERSI